MDEMQDMVDPSIILNHHRNNTNNHHSSDTENIIKDEEEDNDLAYNPINPHDLMGDDALGLEEELDKSTFVGEYHLGSSNSDLMNDIDINDMSDMNDISDEGKLLNGALDHSQHENTIPRLMQMQMEKYLYLL